VHWSTKEQVRGGGHNHHVLPQSSLPDWTQNDQLHEAVGRSLIKNDVRKSLSNRHAYFSLLIIQKVNLRTTYLEKYAKKGIGADSNSGIAGKFFEKFYEH
jgi:hypothetical protein